MRLKSFYGPNSTEAMRLVREALGDNAIIVATRDDEMGGVRVTAAIDDPIAPPAPRAMAQAADESGSDSIELIAASLIRHCVPSALGERLLATATQYASEDALLAIGAAFDTHFKFDPMPDDFSAKPLILVGPPGAGKTLCAAKLATKVTLAKRPVALISTDTERAGGMAQLAAFADLLSASMIEIEDSHALKEAISLQKQGTTIIVDTAGCNPFDEESKQTLAAMIKASGAIPVLVLPADMDSSDAIDMAKAFQLLGARALLPTRLDLTRRLGGLLRTAFETGLPLCNYSATSKVTEAPFPLNPVSLARLILPKKAEPAVQATGTDN